MKRLIYAALLVLILLSTVLTSCTVDKPSGDTTDNGSKQTENSNTDKNGFVLDNLPSDLNFEDKTVNIVINTLNENLFNAEEDSTASLDVAIYKRNLKLEERLKIKLNYISMASGYPDYTQFYNKVGASIQAAEGSFDIIGTTGLYCSGMVMNNYSRDLLENKYLDFDMPWWPNSLQTELKVDDRLYMATGSASLSSLREMSVMVINTDIATDLGLDNIYRTVEKGDWTLDKMSEFEKAAYQDLGNDEYRYGYISNWTGSSYYSAFCVGSGIKVTQIGEDGYPRMNLNSEKTSLVTEAIFNKITSNQGTKNHTTYGKEFENGKSLLMGTTLRFFMASVSDVSFDYGIIPIPKYNSEQESYYTYGGEQYEMFSIPVDCVNFDLSGAVLEAMASENYRSVAPVLYEEVLKVRYSRDNETAKMLDLIRDNLCYDFGIMFTSSFSSGPLFRLRDACFNGSAWTTVYAQYEGAWNVDMGKIIDVLKKAE